MAVPILASQCIAPPMMRKALHVFNGPTIWVEAIYFFVVFLACMLIYFKTKKLYELSSHRGILLFRYAFFFFALATLVKLLMRGERMLVEGPPHSSVYFVAGLFLMSMFGTLSVLSLVGSITWKRMSGFSRVWVFLLLSAIISFAIPFLRGQGQFFLLLSQTVILFIAAALSYWNYLGSKKKSKLYVVYVLLLVAWLLNLVAQFTSRISFMTSIILYAISAAFFVVIVYRVLKVTSKNEKKR